MSPELNSKIAIWRAKCADGTITLDEYKEAIKALRGDRSSAHAASEASGKKRAAAKAAIPDADDMLSELGG